VLTRRIERYVEEHFDPSDAELVLAVLGEWQISYQKDPPTERLTAAIVLFSKGRLEGVDDAFRTAEHDWRDLLVGAGLAHRDWPAVLDARFGPAID
jgi:hypothetical protein